MIAEVVTRGYYTLYERSEWQFHQLRVLVASRERWVQERSRVRNRIIRWVDIWFPELTQVFPDFFTDRPLATLTHFPTLAQVWALTPDTMVDVWRRYGPGGRHPRPTVCAGVTGGCGPKHW